MPDLSIRAEIAVQAAGAFFGALCGFGAAAIKASLDLHRDRRKARRRCLLAIEKDGNHALGLLHENLFEIKSIKEGAKKHDDKASVPFLLNRCGTIPVNPSLLDGI